MIYNTDADMNKEIVVDKCARIISDMLQRSD